MIPNNFGEDWSRNKIVMANLLGSNMKFADFQPFVQDFDLFSIQSNFHFNKIQFLNCKRWFLPSLAEIGQETKKLWQIYCALTWNSPIFDHLSEISTIFSFDQVSNSIKFNSPMVKDDSYQFWWRLVKKQNSYGEFTVL